MLVLLLVVRGVLGKFCFCGVATILYVFDMGGCGRQGGVHCVSSHFRTLI